MKEYQVNKHIQSQGKFLGVKIIEMVLYFALIVFSMVIGNILSFFISVGYYYYIICFLAINVLFVILLIANKKDHPTFLQSLYAFWLQPKKISAGEKINLKSLQQLKQEFVP
ncbi:hypothetical protein [Flexithrix dorotheae]|uniref:hypothetical protein n=1 Tax=Flexithrix dorotheae TaxID=70993 RepID=UPI00037EEB3F|nr:hypothetical protein [Flexithrix dorotheae]